MKLAGRTGVARRVVNLIEKRNEGLINLPSRAGLKLMHPDDFAEADWTANVLVLDRELNAFEPKNPKFDVSGKCQTELTDRERHGTMSLLVEGLLKNESRNERDRHPLWPTAALAHDDGIAGKPEFAIWKQLGTPGQWCWPAPMRPAGIVSKRAVLVCISKTAVLAVFEQRGVTGRCKERGVRNGLGLRNTRDDADEAVRRLLKRELHLIDLGHADASEHFPLSIE